MLALSERKQQLGMPSFVSGNEPLQVIKTGCPEQTPGRMLENIHALYERKEVLGHTPYLREEQLSIKESTEVERYAFKNV